MIVVLNIVGEFYQKVKREIERRASLHLLVKMQRRRPSLQTRCLRYSTPQ
jgi:hypothetical protein